MLFTCSTFGQVPNNFYPADKFFGFGTYEVIANGNDGISDNYIKLFAGDELESEALTFIIRPQYTDNPGVSISGFGVDIEMGPPPVIRGEWYKVTIEVMPDASRLLLNDMEIETWDTPSSLPSEGRYKLAAGYTAPTTTCHLFLMVLAIVTATTQMFWVTATEDASPTRMPTAFATTRSLDVLTLPRATTIPRCCLTTIPVLTSPLMNVIAKGMSWMSAGFVGAEGIPQGACDCDGNVLDECGLRWIGSNPGADAIRCQEGYCDCDGTPIDACGICGGNGQSCTGCIDPSACNFDVEALVDNGLCIYPAMSLVDCFAGAVLCGEGTVWDALTQSCIAFDNCASDLDENGNVGIGDLLLLLADYGNDCEVGCPGVVDACGICNGPGAIYECGCNYLPVGDCDCEGNQPDALGTCGGTCAVDADNDGICDDEDECIGQLDECGVCNGVGAVYECGCTEIAPGDCDCEGQQLDAVGVCGGDCELDENGNGICDSEEEVWSCGDDLLYQGYSYKTTAIGNQCWFAKI